MTEVYERYDDEYRGWEYRQDRVLEQKGKVELVWQMRTKRGIARAIVGEAHDRYHKSGIRCRGQGGTIQVA